ncbi:MAG: Ig-like domain-containing protein [Anaerotignum sp.]|nr:Ig-like domain-containing protein [Anaerotignum sp.]
MKKVKKIISLLLSLIIVLSSMNISVFAERIVQDDEYVASDKDWLNTERLLNGNTYAELTEDGKTYVTITEVTGALNIPDHGQYCDISWSLDNESIIALDGTITQPSYLEALGESKTVTLTASFSYGNATGEKTFYILVPCKVATDTEKLLADDCNMLDSYLKSGYNYVYLDGLDQNLWLPIIISDLPNTSEMGNDSTVTWTSGNENLFFIKTNESNEYVSGIVNRPSYTEGDKMTTLTARVQSTADSTVYKDMEYDITVKAFCADDSESVALVEAWLSDTLVLDGNSVDDVKKDLYLPTEYGVQGEFGMEYCQISWETTDSDVITTNGKVIRPDEGTKTVTLTATISKDGTDITKQFTFTVTAREQSTLGLKFDDFTNAANILQANGKSSINENDSKALSFENNEAGGSIFTKNKIHLNDDLSFSTAFSFKINADEDFPNYGDGGFTFTLQSDSSTAYYSGGDDTNSLGVKGVKPSISIAFDTKYYKTQGSGQGNNYIAQKCLGVFVNGNTDSLMETSNYSTPFPFDLGTAGTVNYAWVEYDGASKALEIRISNSQTRPCTATRKIENVDLPTLLATDNNLTVGDVQNIYAGFTGSAGDMTSEKDDILSWYFKNDSNPIDFDHQSYADASVVDVSAAANGDAGDCTISATVSGTNGTPTEGVPIVFSASKGTLESTSTVTDSSGKASVNLHTASSISGVEVHAVADGGMTDRVVFDLALTPKYVVDFDAERLTDSLILNGNSSLDNVITDLLLPTEGQALYNDGSSEKKSAISWVSSNETYLTNVGKVTNPSPSDGEQLITLKATITLGEASTTKEFNLIIKTWDTADTNADSNWLDTAILNENSALESIRTNLNLPEIGKFGSNISWASSDTAVVKADGTVSNPTFADGDKKIVLTATIVKGEVTITKQINITVKTVEANDTEAVTADASWLEAAILNQNVAVDSITSDLNLPKVGQNGSNITWASSDENTVSLEGKIVRPANIAGDKIVILTASLTKGAESFQKTIKIIVIKLDETEADKFQKDVNWVDASGTLGSNLSQYSIYLDLALPNEAPNGSSITWASSDTSAITDEGNVTRPEYNEENIPVTLTATISGFDTTTKEIEYTVLSKPDLNPPEVTESDPSNGSTDVNYRAKKITIAFNENIEFGTSNASNYGISLKQDGKKSQDYAVGGIDQNTLNITISYLSSGGNYTLTIPKDAITDMSGNAMAEDYTLSFTVETAITKDIAVTSSTPTDGLKNFAGNSLSFSLAYEDGSEIKDSANLRTSGSFDGINLKKRDGNTVKITRALNGNTVTIIPADGQTLEPGAIYILSIPRNAVLDKFNNENRAKTIQFAVATSEAMPEVSSVYPADGQTEVNVNQDIIITFSEDVKFAKSGIQLCDSNGNFVSFYEDRPNNRQIQLRPQAKLSPGTGYTLTLNYNCVQDSSLHYMTYDYTMSFTTGSNTLDINSVSPLTTWDAYGSPIDASVKINLSDSASMTEKAEGITVKDSSGSSVDLDAEMVGSTAILTPSSLLKAQEWYTVTVPEGAFTSESGAVNNARVFRFCTESKIYLNSYDCFTVGPSANWMVNKELSFKSDTTEAPFRCAGRTIRSYEWNFGDGTVGSGKAPKHTYMTAGSYNVTLSMEDNYGFTYEVSKTVNIGNFDSNSVQLSVSNRWNHKIYLSDNPKSGFSLYTVLLSYNGIYVSGEKIEASLYKNGTLVQNLGTYTTGNGSKTFIDDCGFETSDYGMAMVDFWYTGHNYLGIYELVFTYGDADTGKSIRLPVTIVDDRPAPVMLIKLYNADSHTYYETHSKLCFEVDGKKIDAEKEWIDEQNGYCYVIDSVPLGFHNVRLSPTGNAGLYYYSDISSKNHWSATCPVILELMGKQPGINLITSKDGSTSKKHTYMLYFSGVDRPETEFTIDGNWDNLDPGEYQYKVCGANGTERIRSFSSPNISLDLPSLMKPGDKLYFRMVVPGGIVSEWVDAKVEIVAPPETGGTVVYNNQTKTYDSNTTFKLKEILSETPNIFDGIPLLEDDENLAELSEKMFTVTAYSVGGKSQFMKYDFPDELGEMISKGIKLPVQVSGKIILKYNDDSSKWELFYGYITLRRDTNLKSSGKKKIKIPVVNVSATGELKLSALVGATLVMNESDEVDYKYGGVVYIAPKIGADVSTGVGRFDISCFTDASISGQIHTTGYASARATVEVGVKAKAWLIKKTLFKFSLVDEEWDNGGDPILMSARSIMDDSMMDDSMMDELLDQPAVIMPRGYLQRGTEWAAENAPAPLMTLASSIIEKSETMKTNIFPDSQVQLVRHGDELWMIWVDDNPDRSSMNRTQLMYSVYHDGNWSMPAWIGTDATADFGPIAAATDNGVLMAWENMGTELAESAEASDFAANSQISVTKSEFTSDNTNQPEIMTLTNDDKYDHSPQLAASGNNALLVWTKSKELSGTCFENNALEENSDSLYYSCWDGESWSTASEIEGSLPTVVDSSLTMNDDGEGLLLYTLDTDEDMTTTSDQELYARAWKDGVWAEGEKLADTAVNPKAMYVNGDWFIMWNQDGSVMYQTGFTALSKDSGLQAGSAYEITASNGTVALVYTEIGDNNTKSLSAAFYDTSAGIWSGETTLTDDVNGYVQSFSPAFMDNGTLNVAYTQAEMVTESIDGGEYQVPSDKVDLKKLDYSLEHNLAIDSDAGLALNPELPLPEITETVSVTVLNNGDFPENATVCLFDGDPSEGGTLVAQAVPDAPVPAHSSSEVKINWNVNSQQKDKYELYAVVKVADGITESDMSDNSISKTVTTADAEITDVECTNMANDSYIVRATVYNNGSKDLTNVVFALTCGDKTLETITIDKLYSAEETGVDLIFYSKDLTANADGTFDMELKASLAAGVIDNSPDNNTYAFTAEPATIVIKSSNPVMGDAKVDVTKAIGVTFNLNVSEGTAFNQITLRDENLNEVEISKILSDDKLTITPRAALDYHTQYTLKIPVDAVGDSYGHVMKEDCTMSFSTTASTPEVVFSYPGANMEDLSVNAKIEMKYNQSVSKGQSFDKISLCADSKKVPVTATINGEWLYVNPTGGLKTGMEYSLEIPSGSVTNSSYGIQQENYTLTFDTEGTKEANDDPSDDPSDNPSDNPSNNLGNDDNTVTHQKLSDGSVMAVISIDSDNIARTESTKTGMATINATSKVANDTSIQISLTKAAEDRLVSDNMALQVITGRGDVIIPAAWFASLHASGRNAITLTITPANGNDSTDGLVSAEIYNFTLTAGGQQITALGQNFKITIPLDQSKVKNTERVIARTYSETSGSWQALGGTANKENGMLTFGTSHFSSFAAFEALKSFDDVTSSWAKEDVETLASRGLIDGTSNNTFNPNGGITRAEFTALIVRSLYTELSENKGAFTDVPEEAWYMKAVETAYALGLVIGSGENTFSPNANITREQLAVIAYRLYQYKNGTTQGNVEKIFTDSQEISEYAKAAVNFAQNTGIMKGSENRFYPRRNTTRQEAAVVLYRLLKYMKEI